MYSVKSVSTEQQKVCEADDTRGNFLNDVAIKGQPGETQAPQTI